MKKTYRRRFRPSIECLETREVPAFLAPITSPGGGTVVGAGDANLDGYADVAVLQGKKVVVELGNGDGTFRPLTTLTGAKGEIVALSIDDLNSDGVSDVLATGLKPDGWTVDWFGNRVRAYTVFVNQWFGNGDGTFQQVSIIELPRSEYYRGPAYALGNFNGDALTMYDIAYVDTAHNSVNVFLTTGEYTRQEIPLVFPAGTKPSSIAAGDFNGDGWTDLVVTNGSTVSVLFNDGNW